MEHEAVTLLDGRWYSSQELAELLHVDASTIRRSASAGPPTSEQQPVCVRFVRTDCSLAKRSSRPFTHPLDQNEASSGPTRQLNEVAAPRIPSGCCRTI